MEKVIELKLNLNDPFFKELKNKILDTNNSNNFSSEDYLNSIVSPVLRATLKTFEKLATSSKKSDELMRIMYHQKENAYPDFHAQLEDNIDISLSRRIHTTTLERMTDIVEKWMNDYAEQQKNNQLSKLIDSNKELEAITKYISNTWNGFTDKTSAKFFEKVWNDSNDMLKNHFDQYAFTDFIENFNEIKGLSKIKVNGVNAKNLPMYFIIGTYKLEDVISKNWDYKKNVNNILLSIKEDFPYAFKAKPKNWNILAKNYVDYDGMDTLNNKELRELFGGINSGTATSPSFEVRTSLPHVMYENKSQGVKIAEVLIGAIVGHTYVMNEINNSQKMLKEWVDLKKQIELRTSDDISFEFKEPLNQALFDIMRNNGEVKPEVFNILNINQKKKNLKM